MERVKIMSWLTICNPCRFIACMIQEVRQHSQQAHLYIDVANGLVLPAVQPMPSSGLVENRQRHTPWLCTGLVHHISAQRQYVDRCNIFVQAEKLSCILWHEPGLTQPAFSWAQSCIAWQ